MYPFVEMSLYATSPNRSSLSAMSWNASVRLNPDICPRQPEHRAGARNDLVLDGQKYFGGTRGALVLEMYQLRSVPCVTYIRLTYIHNPIPIQQSLHNEGSPRSLHLVFTSHSALLLLQLQRLQVKPGRCATWRLSGQAVCSGNPGQWQQQANFSRSSLLGVLHGGSRWNVSKGSHGSNRSRLIFVQV